MVKTSQKTINPAIETISDMSLLYIRWHGFHYEKASMMRPKGIRYQMGLVNTHRNTAELRMAQYYTVITSFPQNTNSTT